MEMIKIVLKYGKKFVEKNWFLDFYLPLIFISKTDLYTPGMKK